MEKLPHEKSDKSAEVESGRTPLQKFRELSARIIRVPISEFRNEQEKYKKDKKV